MITAPLPGVPDAPDRSQRPAMNADQRLAASPDSERSTLSAIGTIAAGLAVIAIAAGSTAAWLYLRQWWGLHASKDPHYSFEKVQGWFNSPILRETTWLLVGIAIAYAVAILILSWRGALSTWAKLGIAALFLGPAIGNILLWPVGALDVFNYMIELKLTYHYDQNPYLVTFERYRADSYAGPAFLVGVTLFYGPAWLIMTGIPAMIAGFDDLYRTLVALKIFNAGLILVAAVAIALYHRDKRQRWLAVALFAGNPLVLFEGVANAHNDVLLTVFVVGAMVALERKSPLAGPLLALSALVKLYTAALLPIFVIVALRERWSWKRIAVTVTLTTVAVVATCAPYWGEGKLVDGLRAGLEESQEMDHVSPLSLMRQYEQNEAAQKRPDTEYALSRPSFEIVPPTVQDRIDRDFAIAFLAGLAIIAVATWKGRPPALAAAETLLLVFLLMTNLYAWYLIPVIALLALHPDRLSRFYVIIATALGLVYYPMFVFGHYNSGWSRFEIHQFLALFLTAPILLYLLLRLVPWRIVGGQLRRVWAGSPA
jgi:hypothetical protein